MNNDTAKKVAELERTGVGDFSSYKALVAGVEAFEAYKSGDFEKGILSLGPAVAFADQIEPASNLLERIIDDAKKAHHRLHSLTVAPKTVLS